MFGVGFAAGADFFGVIGFSGVFVTLLGADFLDLPAPKYSDVVVASPSGVEARFFPTAFFGVDRVGLWCLSIVQECYGKKRLTAA